MKAGLLLIIGLLMVAYGNTWQVPFLLDDFPNIVDNPTLRAWDLTSLLQPPVAIVNRPLLNVSLAFSYALSGQQPWGYHFFNIMVHLLAMLVLFGLVRRTLVSFPRAFLPATPFALAVTAWWGLHPVHTQAVTYIIQRCEAVAGLMVMVALYAAIRGWEHDRYRRAWFAGAVLAMLVGVGFKETAAIALPLILLYDRFYRGHALMTAMRQSGWLYPGLAMVLVVLAINIHRTGLTDQLAHKESLIAQPWGYALVESGVILHYLRLALWPDALTLDYAWPVANAFTLAWTASVVVVAIAVSVTLYHRRHPAGFPLIWWWLTLAPSSSFIPLVDPVFEQRLYLPLAGLTMLVLGVLFALGRRWHTRLAVYPLVAVAVILASVTLLRNHDYRTAEAIYRDNVHKSPDHYRPRFNLALELQTQGRHEEALDMAAKGWDLNPHFLNAPTILSISLIALGRYEEALSLLPLDLQRHANSPWTHYYMGIALRKVQRHEEALEHFAQAVVMYPGFPQAAVAHRHAGEILLAQGEPRWAAEHFRLALARQPQDPDLLALLNRAEQP